MAYSPDHSLDPSSGAPSDAPAQPRPAVPDPLAAIAYASCRGADIEPPLESDLLTSRAAYERLNRAAARAETLVLYRLDMLAGCRDSLDVDQVRLEASVQNLWRLTAVRKTLLSIEAALSAPTPAAPPSSPSLQELSRQCETILKSITEAESLSPPVPFSPAPTSPAPSESVSVGVGPCSSVSSPSSAQSTPSITSTSSIPSIGSIGSIPPVSPSPSPQVPPSPGPQVPLSSSSLAIRAVPSCPRLSVSSISRTLDRINSDADMANYPEHVSTVADYDFNVTAEEFLRPSRTPASLAASVAEDSDSPLLADPDLSPSLKAQISNLKPTISPSPCPPVAQSPSPQVSLSSSPHSALRIPHSPRSPD